MCATGSEGNIGTRNKGMGELLMLKTALDQTDLEQYENVSYISARKVFTCPYVFERTERLEKSALISNPDFLFLDGRLTESYKGPLYNDMFFSMKTKCMVEYAEHSMSELNSNLSNHIGSEQNLYNYITTNDIDYEWLDFLGLIRNDWEINGQTLDVSNYTFVDMEIRDTVLPVLRPVGGDEELDSLRECIETGWWGKGPRLLSLKRSLPKWSVPSMRLQ